MRLDAYIRVSDVHGRGGESYVTKDQQRERIDGWAKSQGHEIIRYWEEENVSGGKTDRPMLNEVMRRIKTHETDGVVVAKLDRFGRTLTGSLRLIEEIHGAGALFASVAESFDITTPMGRMVVNIMLSIAQWELERITDNWVDVNVRAVKRGAHVGPTPFGYVKDENSRLSPDPEWGYIITGLFQRRAAGESWTAIRRWIETEGAPCPEASGWNSSRLSKVIDMEVYLGVVAYSPRNAPVVRTEGAHKPLTDLATWHAAQQRRAARHVGADVPQLLKGIVRCAGCRYAMTQRPQPFRPEHPDYICKRITQADDCKAPARISSLYQRIDRVGIDEYVTEALLARWPEIVATAYGTGDADLERLKAAAESATLEANQHAVDTEAKRRMKRERYFALAEALDREAENANTAYEQALAERTGVMSAPSRTLVEDWRNGTLTMAEKHEQLAAVIQAVFVKRGDLRYHDKQGKLRTRITGASPDTVHIVWFDDPQLVDIPAQGKRNFVAHPFPFPVGDDPVDVGELAA